MASDRITKETSSRDVLRRNFSNALRTALMNRMGKMPSSTHFANQFNFRSQGTTAITRETARKWVTGQAIPEIERLQILIEWLELDPQKFLFTSASQAAVIEPGTRDDLIIETVVELLRKMDPKTRSVVLITAWALLETNSSPLEHLNLQALRRSLISTLTVT